MSRYGLIISFSLLRYVAYAGHVTNYYTAWTNYVAGYVFTYYSSRWQSCDSTCPFMIGPHHLSVTDSSCHIIGLRWQDPTIRRGTLLVEYLRHATGYLVAPDLSSLYITVQKLQFSNRTSSPLLQRQNPLKDILPCHN
jgi:hypothetical protein